MAEQREVSLGEVVGRIAGIATRRRWWIITVSAGVALAAIAFSFHLPNKYTSDATLVVVQQQVSQHYVEPSSSMISGDIVRAITRQILSRNQLLGIIDAFGLYPQEKQKLPPEQLAERMRKDVSVELLDPIPGRSDFGAFKISFSASSPRLAQEVTSRLTSLFIEENLRTRGTQAATTAKFLADQLEDAKQRLAQQEQRLRDFKASNLGELPEQSQTNLGILTDLRIQLQSVSGNLNRAQQQKTSLESALNGNLARLQSERAALLTRYTARHPEVLKMDQEVERTSSLLARLKSGNTNTAPVQALPGPDDPTVAQLKAQVEANLADCESLASEEQRLKSEIARYQRHLNLTPLREQQLSAIVRDYELYKQDYTDLLNKQLRSQVAVNLEEGNGAQHFRLVDPPSLPFEPSSPNRFKISVGAVAAGLALGVALAFVVDQRRSSFHSEKEIRDRFSVPVMVGIPLLLTPAELRHRRWKHVLEWAAGSALTLVVLAAEFYVYRHG
jgi:polysaccharide biosynthesis transport protein